MNLSFRQKARSGAVVTVNAWITFENKPVMRLQDFHNVFKLSQTKKFLVRMELDYPTELNTKRVGKLSHEKISAYYEGWATLSDYKLIIESYERFGYDFIFCYELTEK